MKYLVRAKSWEIFSLLLAAYFLSTFIAERLDDQILYFLCKYPFAALLFAWLYSIGLFSNKSLDSELRKSPNWIAAGVIFSILSMSIYFLMELNCIVFPSPWIPMAFAIATMICVIATLYYAANRLVTLERGRKVSGSECISTFFMLYAFPVGIWFIQPRANRILSSRDA